jgi:hypothetical protein
MYGFGVYGLIIYGIGIQKRTINREVLIVNSKVTNFVSDDSTTTQSISKDSLTTRSLLAFSIIDHNQSQQ